MHLPIEFSSKRGKIETKILEFSNKIFQTKFGILFAILNNAIYLYLCYYKNYFFGIFIYFYFLVLVSHIIMHQFARKV